MNTPRSNALAQVRRYASIYAALWRNSVVREMSFKSNFLLWIIVEFLWFGLQLSFVGVIYLHTDHIATWTKWDVVMLIGASHFIQEMFQAFFLTNCTQLSELVRTGRLDFMLLLPANARFLISLRQVDLGGFVNGACGLAVMAYAAHQEHLVPSAAQVIAFVLLCGVGILVHYSLMFLLASVAFWTVRAQGIVWGYYSLFNVARLPDEAFQGWFRAFFTFAVPMLLVVNVPVRVLLNRLTSPGQMFLLLGAGCICFVLSELFWRFSIRHYTSASA
jgi:ABC-2 type transport system permease protein